MDKDIQEKWDRRYREARATPPAVAVVRENLHLLPPQGRALDIACGLGGNALALARHGLETEAWDLSPVAIERLRREAAGLPLSASVRDVLADPPPPASYDVITVAHFLERDLMPVIADALRPRGLLFYQTFTQSPVDTRGPSDIRFRLRRNELLQLFPALTVVLYREEDRLGDTSRGFRSEAMLIAQRPNFV
jgi:tellurite methyltransferase